MHDQRQKEKRAGAKIKRLLQIKKTRSTINKAMLNKNKLVEIKPVAE